MLFAEGTVAVGVREGAGATPGEGDGQERDVGHVAEGGGDGGGGGVVGGGGGGYGIRYAWQHYCPIYSVSCFCVAELLELRACCRFIDVYTVQSTPSASEQTACSSCSMFVGVPHMR